MFSSDALSSVAYATEEAMLVLAIAGVAAFTRLVPITLAIAVLFTIVIASYRQTIRAYPLGGGSFIVSYENLGLYPGAVAGAALLTDYTLTVAVSVSAGTAAITSALPELLPYRVLISIFFVVLISVANLRGTKESSTVFAFPTYALRRHGVRDAWRRLWSSASTDNARPPFPPGSRSTRRSEASRCSCSFAHSPPAQPP